MPGRLRSGNASRSLGVICTSNQVLPVPRSGSDCRCRSRRSHTMAISLVLVDDHPFLLDGLEQLLSLDGGFDVLAKCGTVEEGLHAVKTFRPDVLILDLKLRDKDGF